MPINVALGEYGPWTLVGMFVILIATGGLVPRWTFNRFIKDKDTLIDRLTRALDKRDEQFDTLIAQGEVNTKLLEDLKAASKLPEARH